MTIKNRWMALGVSIGILAAFLVAKHQDKQAAGAARDTVIIDGVEQSVALATATGAQARADAAYTVGTGAVARLDIAEPILATAVQPSELSAFGEFDLFLPPTIYGVEGFEATMYLDNIMYGDYADYFWEIDGTAAGLGKQYSDAWRYTPATATNGTLTIKAIRRFDMAVMASNQVSLAVASAAAYPVSTRATVATPSAGSAAGVISGWGALLNHPGKFNEIVIPFIRRSATQTVARVYAEVRAVTLTADAGNQLDVRNGSVIATGSVAVVDNLNLTNTTIRLNVPVRAGMVPGAMFIGVRAFTDDGMTADCYVGRPLGAPSNRHANLHTHYYGYGNWASDSGDTAIGFTQRLVLDTATVLPIGDSTTGTDKWNTTLYETSTNSVPVLTMIGTQGTAPHLNEGNSGKTWAWFYSDAASPFVTGGAFSFQHYLTNNTFATPDIVLVHLGINDLLTSSTVAAVDARWALTKPQIDAMIASIHTVDPDTVIGLMATIPPAYDQDAAGDDYSLGMSRWETKMRQVRWAKLLTDAYPGTNDTHVIPVNVALDTRNGMPTSSVAISARNTNTVTRMTNLVHPAASGYSQMSDAVWAWIKNLWSDE